MPVMPHDFQQQTTATAKITATINRNNKIFAYTGICRSSRKSPAIVVKKSQINSIIILIAAVFRKVFPAHPLIRWSSTRLALPSLRAMVCGATSLTRIRKPMTDSTALAILR